MFDENASAPFGHVSAQQDPLRPRLIRTSEIFVRRRIFPPSLPLSLSPSHPIPLSLFPRPTRPALSCSVPRAIGFLIAGSASSGRSPFSAADLRNMAHPRRRRYTQTLLIRRLIATVKHIYIYYDAQLRPRFWRP